MKKSTIICTLVGGAIVGTAVAMFIKSKRGGELRQSMHKKIHEKLQSIQENLESCSCMLNGGECECNKPTEQSSEPKGMEM